MKEEEHGHEIRGISGNESVKHAGQESESSSQGNHDRPSGSYLPIILSIFVDF